jgi:hypothetical protein
MKAFRKQRRVPWRWLQKEPVQKLGDYKNALTLEKQAQTLLEQYERELKNI